MRISRVASIQPAVLLLCLFPVAAYAAWGPNGLAVATTVGAGGAPRQYIGAANGALVSVVDTAGVIVAQGSAGGSNMFDGASDGSGGLVLTYAPSQIFANRFNSSATPLWGSGVLVCNITGCQIPVVACDATANSYVAWKKTATPSVVFAQKLSPAGTPLWTANGVVVTSLGIDATTPILAVASDGSGGCVVVWEDHRAGVTGPADLRAQRIDASGTAAWAANGIVVAQEAGTQKDPVAITLSSGVMVAWMDNRSGIYDIYAQRLDLAGTPQWTANGVAVCAAASDQGEVALEPDGSDGAYVAWTDYRTSATTGSDVFVQRVNSAGTSLWTADGVAACASSGDQDRASLLVDGAGGVFVGWHPGSAQHFDGAGLPLWPANGVKAIEAVGSGTLFSSLAPDGAGGVFVGSGQLLGRVRSVGEAAWITNYRVVLSGAADVPGDEGGWISLAFPRPPIDGSLSLTPSANGYALWRRQPGSSVSGPAQIVDPLGLVSGFAPLTGTTGHGDFPPGTWEYVGFQPASQSASYGFLGPTHTDSTASGSANEQFLVVTHTSTPPLFVVSEPATGHSVDNLAPGPPLNLSGVSTGTGSVRLQWAPSSAADLWHYSVHRGTDPAFVPSPGNRIAQPLASSYEDPGFIPDVSHYKVAAVDRHDNVSGYAALTPGQIVSVPTGTTPGRSYLGAPAPNPSRGNTGFEFGLAQVSHVSLSIYDIHGRKVAPLLNESRAAGVYRAEWNGRDAAGHSSPAGIYLVRMDAGGVIEERKLVMSR